MPIAEKPQMECILDKRVAKKTRRKQYFEYLVKWKNHPVEDASWESKAVIQKHGQTMRSSWTGAHEIFQAGEYDAGASPTSSEPSHQKEDSWTTPTPILKTP
jgi:ABC-type thiamine transport system substrate-binding protein